MVVGFDQMPKSSPPSGNPHSRTTSQAEIASAEKAKLQRQKTEEKIKAAQRKHQAKNDDKPQPSQPAAEEIVRTDTLAEGSDSLPDEISNVSELVNGKQQSLFG